MLSSYSGIIHRFQDQSQPFTLFELKFCFWRENVCLLCFLSSHINFVHTIILIVDMISFLCNRDLYVLVPKFFLKFSFSRSPFILLTEKFNFVINLIKIKSFQFLNSDYQFQLICFPNQHVEFQSIPHIKCSSESSHFFLNLRIIFLDVIIQIFA